MAAESARIGLGSCPVCASPKAHYTLSKKGLVCVTCNSCNFQGFARSERSDEILRGHIKPPESVSPVAPVAAAAAEVVNTPPTVTKKPEAPERRGSLMSW